MLFDLPTHTQCVLLSCWHRRMALLAAGDLAVLLVFAAVGRHSHGEPLTVSDTFNTALPFILGETGGRATAAQQHLSALGRGPGSGSGHKHRHELLVALHQTAAGCCHLCHLPSRSPSTSSAVVIR